MSLRSISKLILVQLEIDHLWVGHVHKHAFATDNNLTVMTVNFAIGVLILANIVRPKLRLIDTVSSHFKTVLEVVHTFNIGLKLSMSFSIGSEIPILPCTVYKAFQVHFYTLERNSIIITFRNFFTVILIRICRQGYGCR